MPTNSVTVACSDLERSRRLDMCTRGAAARPPCQLHDHFDVGLQALPLRLFPPDKTSSASTSRPRGLNNQQLRLPQALRGHLGCELPRATHRLRAMLRTGGARRAGCIAARRTSGVAGSPPCSAAARRAGSASARWARAAAGLRPITCEWLVVVVLHTSRFKPRRQPKHRPGCL